MVPRGPAMQPSAGQWGRLYLKEFEAVCKSVTPAQASVYVFLALKRNSKTGMTPPIGVSLIMGATGLKRRCVFGALSALSEKGLIEKHPRGNRAAYGFPMVRLDALSEKE